ncbi:MAG: hypothetical protein PHD72_04515 [Patescibacteria group bacterium]|nr:hypothetical protein [Patescibacteria group bacterium]
MANRISKIIAAAVVLVGLIVMAGWIFGIQFLKSILPQLVTMKFTTAVCFVFSGVVLYLKIINFGSKRNDWANLLSILLNFSILLIMSSLIISIFTGVKTGVEDLIIEEPSGAINTTAPGRPSLVTMADFVLVAIVGLSDLTGNPSGELKLSRIFGTIIVFTGCSAIIGYIANIPALYGQFSHISSAMALHTAVLLVFLGIGFVSIRTESSPATAKKLL